MVRVPCCENMGLKKGPWTPEEDEILVAYIQRYGHSNWRALPKQAGLLRCGKSCRLRWINYLRPDIKRGNFSNEEEETIIMLHQILGNRWSTIAARLPGRTDNEIKNYWHTHLRKRFEENYATTGSSSYGPCTKTSKRAVINNNARSTEPPMNFTTTTTTYERSEVPSHIEPAKFTQESLSQELFSVRTVEANNGSNINHNEFWYDLYMNAGNWREVHENL